MDDVVLEDGHGCVIARFGVVLVWHDQAECQFVPDPRLQLDLVHRDVEELLSDGVPAVMADHELATARTGVLVSKLVIADRHVHCTHLNDKCIDAHGELGEHGDERAVHLAKHH